MINLMTGRGRERGGSRVFDSSEIENDIDLASNVNEIGPSNQDFIQVEQERDSPYHLDKFRLYETPFYYYLVGLDKEGKRSRVLKIGRSEPTKLLIYEDPKVYPDHEYKFFSQDTNEGNSLRVGPKFVTKCYGIVGFIKFLGPYYVILITKRREIGQICGHPIYSVSEYKMIPISHLTEWYLDNLEKENRYKKLLWLVDITKNFYFSYSYPLMHSLQRNLCQKETRQSYDGTMFVWNESITRQIRDHLKNTLWTVALIHGFFKQVKLANQGKNFIFTLIARRLSHFAGTRFQTRGVNKKGHAANDIEVEQIVSPEIHGDCMYSINAVMQNRGSVPLRWSQKPSWLNFKPDIIFSEDDGFKATQFHFQHLRTRYEDPIIIFDLVKTNEKKPRETLLHDKYKQAVAFINKSSCKEEMLEFWELDINAHFKSQGIAVLQTLKEYAANALKQVGFFSGQIPQTVTFETSSDLSWLRIDSNCTCSKETRCSNGDNCKRQKGVLRTNCVDSLDRTNVAQYLYTLVALGHQLHDLQITDSPEQELSQTLVNDIMSLYEDMGNALAQQYGGSAAHTKIFSKIRGQWKAAIQFREFVKSIQRHYNNAFNDIDKQKAIDLLLGHFKPEEVESTQRNTNLDQQHVTGSHSPVYQETQSRPMLRRSQSDSEIFYNRSPDTGDETNTSATPSSRSAISFRSCVPYPYRSSEQFVHHLENQWYGSVCNCNEYAEEVGSTLDWII